MSIAIVVHGGAGSSAAVDDADRAREGCLAAARRGYALLRQGASALDAVEAAATVLEDDPRFNAGTGSCLTRDGEVEMDACLMDGADLRVGAVALVRTMKNPIRLARAVMERTPHVLLAGEGASRLAGEAGLEQVSPSSLVTERSLRRWREHLAKSSPPTTSGGTIGAVAIDARGHVAAATSTGGMTGKLPGRIGDTPIPGAGTYADDASGAASATGHGEMILRVTLTRVVCDRLGAGETAMAAASAGIRALERVQGSGGVIVVGRSGDIGWAFNTERMSRAWIDGAGAEGSAFGSDD